MVLDLGRARRRLTAAGMEEDTANAVADVIADATDDLATKQDIAELKEEIARLDGKIDALIGQLEGKIGLLEGKIGLLEGKFFRALWLQGIGLILAGTALLGIQTAILVALLG